MSWLTPGGVGGTSLFGGGYRLVDAGARTSRGPRSLAAAVVIVGLVTLSVVLIDPGLGAVAVSVAAAVAVLACAAAAQRGGPVSHGWWWVAAAVLAWSIGQFVRTLPSPEPHGSPGGALVTEIGLAGYVVPSLVALWILSAPERTGIVFARQVLDGLIVGGCVLFIGWIDVLETLVIDGGNTMWRALRSSGPPSMPCSPPPS